MDAYRRLNYQENTINNIKIQPQKLVIDHLLIGSPDLELGCQAFVELCGVEPILGGSHPGIGTRNALIGLEDDIYIEIIAPDPEQSSDLPLSKYLQGLELNSLMWWVARCHDFDAVVKKLQKHDIEIKNRATGSRQLPDGRELHWDLLIPSSSIFQAALPFFINWKDMALHPSRELPLCGKLNSLEISHTASDELRQILGSCFQEGCRPKNQLLAKLNINGNTVCLATPDDFPLSIGEIS